MSGPVLESEGNAQLSDNICAIYPLRGTIAICHLLPVEVYSSLKLVV